MKSVSGLIALTVAFVASLVLSVAPLACGPKGGARSGTSATATLTERTVTAEEKPYEFEDPALTAAPATARPRPGPR